MSMAQQSLDRKAKMALEDKTKLKARGKKVSNTCADLSGSPKGAASTVSISPKKVSPNSSSATVNVTSVNENLAGNN
jgi:hypothetical protein